MQTGTEEFEQMTALRMKVLLDPLGVPRSYINPDREANEYLVGAFDHGQLIGCCILTPSNARTIQLRQMAVEHQAQGRGVGRMIIDFAERFAKEKGFTVLMMHAREVVMEFYTKCGYHISGDRFYEVGISHFKMQKQLP